MCTSISTAIVPIMKNNANPSNPPPSSKKALKITGIPAFQDNYLWLIDDGEYAVAVDPGDAQPILDEINKRNLTLASILVTHHHADHIGGIDTLLKHYSVPVIGPADSRIPQVTQRVVDGETYTLLGQTAQVIEVPGHTLHHIAYFINQPNSFGAPLLFCGDTLFAAGCGRVFEGTFAQMRHSLAKLRELPESTRIYCAHEYTQANLAFALAVEPKNKALQQRIKNVNELRAAGYPSIPSILADELGTNPFLRYDTDPVISAAGRRTNTNFDAHNNGVKYDHDVIFAVIRQWKDTF